MFTRKDIEYRSLFIVNCMDKRALRVENGELLLKDTEANKTLTKLPFQKILALFIIGHASVTSPLIDKCTRFGVPLVLMKPNLRPVFFFSITAEANYLLRQKQYEWDRKDIQIPKILVTNKIKNQLRLLEKTRKTNPHTESAKDLCSKALAAVDESPDYDTVMGLEGRAAKSFFAAYFEEYGWKARCPRAKTDIINVTLDIGYTILFNYIESFVRLFGFDPYIGVYHRLWFKRKSLICDLMEPFRCMIDQQVRKAFNTGQCKEDDFMLFKNEYVLKHDKNGLYTRMFFDVLIAEKSAVFIYIRDYYRCFMQCKSAPHYPQYYIK